LKRRSGESWPSASSATATIATGNSAYVGRFAPSPTGPLHFGSLLAATASYLQARHLGGRWLLRIEDIDPPREQPDAARRIVEALECYGFEWDGPVIYQSGSQAAHAAALQRLLDDGHAYRCGCSRSDLADAPRGPLGIIYPGTCRTGTTASETAIRVRTDDSLIGFIDGLQGAQQEQLESESGDFVVWRRDGLVAYHLAVVVDDHEQGITEIVRGIDLMDSTCRQIWLQQLLGFRTPSYVHIPVASHADGQKLSKLTGASAVSLGRPQEVLVQVLAALGQRPPGDLGASALDEIWAWAIGNWRIDVLAGKRRIRVDADAMAEGKNGLL
jgi:glutamyl-Q tRNA(Asp) synthetase